LVLEANGTAEGVTLKFKGEHAVLKRLRMIRSVSFYGGFQVSFARTQIHECLQE